MYVYIYVYVYDTVGLDAIPISLFKKNSQTSYNVTREYVVVSCFCNGDWKNKKHIQLYILSTDGCSSV